MKRREPNSQEIQGYETWEQVSGFFDGDGGVRLRVGLYTVLFILHWTDKMLAQVKQIRSFLRIHGLARGSRIDLTGSTGVHTLFVHRQTEVREIAKCMLPHCFKKKAEVALIVEYLEDRATGNEVIRTFNKRTMLGYRKGKVHKLSIPYYHSEGVSKAMQENEAKGARARIVLLPEEEAEIRRKRDTMHLTHAALANEYGVSATAIRNSLRRQTDSPYL